MKVNLSFALLRKYLNIQWTMLMRENLMHAAGGCWVVQINNPSMLRNWCYNHFCRNSIKKWLWPITDKGGEKQKRADSVE